MSIVTEKHEDIFIFIPTIRFVGKSTKSFEWFLSLDWMKFSIALAKRKAV